VSQLRKKAGKADKEPGKLGKLITLGSSVTLIPVLRSRFRKARAEGDKLNQLEAVLSAAVLAVGAAKVLRKKKPAAKGGD
jgi:hypothetical protein